MTHTLKRLAAFKTRTGVYSYDRAEEAAQAAALKRAAFAAMTAEYNRRQRERRAAEKKAADRLSRVPVPKPAPLVFDRALFDRAASKLADVHGPVPGDARLVAAVEFALSMLRASGKPWRSLREACARSGVSRDEMSRCVLAMKGAK